MAPTPVRTPNLLVEPGYLFGATLGTAIPTQTAAASVFSDVWPAAFVPLGPTAEGSTLAYSTQIEAMSVAEFYDPVKYATVSRAGSISFALADFTLHSLKRALNGGMGVMAPTSGTGVTALTKFTPPKPGQEVRVMIAWESLDNTLRLFGYQCINGSEISMALQKAPNFATIPCTFNFEISPTTGDPFELWAAGLGRLGT